MIKKMKFPFKKIDGIFATVVILPNVLALAYFGVFASDVYISESSFAVHTPDKSSTSGLGLVLKSVGFSNAGSESYAIRDFILSRDAAVALNKIKLYQVYGNKNISVFDRFDPLGTSHSFEDLYKFYRGKVGVEHDNSSSITRLVVRAYTAEDAQFINRSLLERAEAVANRLNRRGREDLIRYASTEVSEAKAEATRAAVALASFRNRAGVVDPERQAAVQLQMISKLQDELIGSRMQLLQMRSLAPANPQIPALKLRVDGLGREITAQLGMVAGNSKSLSGTASEFRRLQLEGEVADKRLASAMSALDDAQNEARRKQVYIERIAQPNRPDDASEPHRLRSIFATFVVSLIVWMIVMMLLAGVREHSD